MAKTTTALPTLCLILTYLKANYLVDVNIPYIQGNFV